MKSDNIIDIMTLPFPMSFTNITGEEIDHIRIAIRLKESLGNNILKNIVKMNDINNIVKNYGLDEMVEFWSETEPVLLIGEKELKED